tara:strand:+ start:61699 stop:61977 length:279 start_codon:yes stop_codon:yes gene_type:complete
MFNLGNYSEMESVRQDVERVSAKETFEEVAVYNQPPPGHKYQFSGVSIQFPKVPAIFHDQKITRQFTAPAAAFSENALLNSDVSPAVLVTRN